MLGPMTVFFTSDTHFGHGATLGLETILFQDQGRYLVDVGAGEIEEIVSRDAGKFSRARSAVHQLTHPSLMGRAFKVLIQRKA